MLLSNQLSRPKLAAKMEYRLRSSATFKTNKGILALALVSGPRRTSSEGSDNRAVSFAKGLRVCEYGLC